MTARFHRPIRPFLPFLLLGAIALSPAQAERLDHADFSRVAVESGMRVEIRQGDTFHVEVDAAADDLDRLRVEQRGDRLRFYFDRGVRRWRSTGGRVEISIQMPELESLSLSGGSRGVVEMANLASDFRANLSGGSRLEGRIRATAIDFSLSGGSRATLAGRTGALKLSSSGGSHLDLGDLPCDSVDAKMSGGSHARVSTNGTIDASLSGGSRVSYYGNPSLGRISASGGSRVASAE